MASVSDSDFPPEEAPAWWPDPIGPARVIVPIVATSSKAAQDQAIKIADTDAEMVEWRADYLAEQPRIARGVLITRLPEADRIVALASILRVLVAPKPLIFTWRTIAEGGDGSPLGDGNYEAVTQAVIRAHAASVVDVEVRHPASLQLIAAARDYKVPVIGSWHDVAGTPSENAIVRTLALIEEAGVDIVKVAVTARRESDATTLMNATAERVDDARAPLITMAMGEWGLVSRVLGHMFGSAATFATVGAPSAPGQPELAELRRLWEMAE